MAEFSFFWHDYETFGRVPRRDRPAQFAGVRTDAELNEIGAPVMLFCQPAPDILPDPESCLLTGILPQHALQQGVPEHEFAAAHRSASWRARHRGRGLQQHPLRRRGHALPVLAQPDRPLRARMAERLRPLGPAGRGALHLGAAARGHRVADYSDGEQGRPSFKLEHLTAANGLAHEAAHDALSDVRATMALARLIKRSSRGCGTSA